MSKDQLIIGTVFDQASDAMMITDAAERILRINRKFTQLTGYEPEDIIGQTPAILRSGKNDPQLFTTVWNAVNSGGHWQGEIWNRKKNGRLFIADLTISAVVNHHNKVSYYLGVYRDITSAKEEQMKRRMQETREPQTFLLNRAAFFEQLKEACGAAGPGALLLLNLDKFREVNDLYGVEAGDTILFEAARRLRKCLRDSDIIGRLDGDEFAVIVPSLASLADIEKVTDKILTRLLAPYDLGTQKHVTVPASIGLAPLPGKSAALDSLLRSVNQALHNAKQRGGGRWQRAETAKDSLKL